MATNTHTITLPPLSIFEFNKYTCNNCINRFHKLTDPNYCGITGLTLDSLTDDYLCQCRMINIGHTFKRINKYFVKEKYAKYSN